MPAQSIWYSLAQGLIDSMVLAKPDANAAREKAAVGLVLFV